MTPTHFNGDAIRKLAEILADTNLTEIEYEENGTRIYLARHPAPVNVNAAAFPAAAPVISATAASVDNAKSDTSTDFNKHAGAVKSPMVGTVYLAPTPGAAAFIKIGDRVALGQTLLIVEAMKVMNPIKSPKEGLVTHLLVGDASPVEFDQPLVIIE